MSLLIFIAEPHHTYSQLSMVQFAENHIKKYNSIHCCKSRATKPQNLKAQFCCSLQLNLTYHSIISYQVILCCFFCTEHEFANVVMPCSFPIYSHRKHTCLVSTVFILLQNWRIIKKIQLNRICNVAFDQRHMLSSGR